MEKNNMKFNLEHLPSSVKKGDIIGSAIHEEKLYDAVWVGGDASNFKLVEKTDDPKSSTFHV